MGKSALSGIGFPEVNLKFSAGGGGMIRDPDGKLDEDGMPIYIPNPASSITLRAKLKPTSDPTIISLIGTDTSAIPLKGLCMIPRRIPAKLTPGMECPLVMDGIPGRFTLLPWFRSQHEAAVDAIGQRLAGKWVPT